MKYEIDRVDESIVTLDTYNSDLNLVIDASKYSAHPLTQEGFAFMWAGARATHGAEKGTFCFEVKVLEHLDVSHLPADEPNPHVLRVGFSVDSTSMQLGEEPLSYGYGGTGKTSTDCRFKDFGPPFTVGDCVLAVVNYDADPVQIGFAKNGNFVGWAYRINKSELKGKALFPHVLTKNSSFEVNFGQRGEPYFKLPEAVKDFSFIGCLPSDVRVPGTRAPEKREDCEMIMMCGLPGAGKSVWAADYSLKNPEKKYNVLGTNNIIDKMKVMGLPRKRNYHGRWDVLIQMATKCLNTMFSIGSKLRRNYILDQTNVYPTAQRRKMRNFDGFRRTAVVVIPTDVEYKRRCDKRDREEGKEIPDHAVLEMKANFKIPEENDLFEKIIFTELQREDAEKLVKQYNEEGKAATGPSKKQFRSNESGAFGERKGNFGGFNQRDEKSGSNYGGYGGHGRDNFEGPGGFDSGRDIYGRGDDYRSGYGSPGGRGGFDNGRGGRGGYDSGRGGRGFDSGRGGRGGFDSGRGGRGGFDSGRGGRGGYDNDRSRGGRSGYDGGGRGERGGFEGHGGRGGYDGGRGERSGFESGRGERGGFDGGRGERGGYESRGERGGYESRGERGGYDGGRGGRGGFDGGRGGRSGNDGGRGGRGRNDNGRGGRGGYDNGRGGRGGYDSRSGRGGFDSNRGGRGGYDRGSRDSYEGSYTGGYGSPSADNRRDSYDNYGNSSRNPQSGNYGYNKPNYDQAGDNMYGSSGYSSASNKGGYDSGNYDYGGDKSFGSNMSGSYGRGGSSSAGYQPGGLDNSRPAAQSGYGVGSAYSAADSQNEYYTSGYGYDSTRGYRSFGSTGDSYSSGTETSNYTGATTVKNEPADRYGSSNTDTSSRYSQGTGSGYSTREKVSRWGAENPTPAAPSYSTSATSTYDYSKSDQAVQGTQGYDYGQGVTTAAQQWTGAQATGSVNPSSYSAGQAGVWPQYGQQPAPYQYYSQ